VKALIFAAGLGTRLKPLTETMPKALVPVGGKPLLEHAILKLKSAGINEIIINVHHFADQIIDFVRSRNSFDIHIEFSDERNLLLDTGGGLKKASHFFNDNQPFFVYNVDILSNIDLKQMYVSHLQSKPLSTIFVSERKTNRYLLFNDENRLIGWYNQLTGETKPKNIAIIPEKHNQLAFNGIHIISPEIFPLMENCPDKFSITDFYLSIAKDVNIQAFQQKDSQTIDVGKIDTIKTITDNSCFLK
jgi:NDP-sugar pyrophosphorylase family protein